MMHTNMDAIAANILRSGNYPFCGQEIHIRRTTQGWRRRVSCYRYPSDTDKISVSCDVTLGILLDIEPSVVYVDTSCSSFGCSTFILPRTLFQHLLYPSNNRGGPAWFFRKESVAPIRYAL